MGGLTLEAVLLLWIGCGAACGAIAYLRDSEPVNWFVLGLITGPLGVLWCLKQTQR